MSPVPKTPKKLTDAEVQAVADHAFEVWENGRESEFSDGLGVRWLFRRTTDPANGLRFYVQPDPALPVEDGKTGLLLGSELGVDKPLPVIASRILAMSEPPIPPPEPEPEPEPVAATK